MKFYIRMQFHMYIAMFVGHSIREAFLLLDVQTSMMTSMMHTVFSLKSFRYSELGACNLVTDRNRQKKPNVQPHGNRKQVMALSAD